MMKSLLLLICSLFSATLFACNCFSPYQTLTEKACELSDYGGFVFEMRLNRTTTEGAFFTVENVLTGELTQQEIFVYAGDNGNCGLPVHEYPVNSRYLYFAGPATDSTGVDYSFECGPARNIYALNGNSTQIRYMTPGEVVDGNPGALEWQDYSDLLENAPCELATSLGTTENPFKAIGLTANPGSGIVQLYTVGNSFPEIDKIQVFDIAGRLVFSSSFAASTPTQPYDLTKLPIGVYAVVVSNQKWRRGMKYVKVR